MKDPVTGAVRKEVKQNILLMAIEIIQTRTRKELGAWSQVHWLRRAPFKHSFQESQEATLLSETPILHMSSAEGFFQGVLMDAKQIPVLEVDEAMEILIMAASFLELSNLRPVGKALRKVEGAMADAVKNMNLQEKIRAKYKAKIEQQEKREQEDREWQNWQGWQHSKDWNSWNKPSDSSDSQWEEC